jgi:HK97 family phage prohead protease
MSEHGPIEIRKATVSGVDYPERQITVLAVPYDEWTPVEYRGRVIEESIAPGAFGGVAERARKISVNMEHDPARWIGQVRSIWSDAAGLHARIRIRRDTRGTQEFDQVLDDAADGMLGASVGMQVAADGQSMTGNRRRIAKAFLDHLALTAQPAYAGAEVVDVRSMSTSATPRLDAILAERAAAGLRSPVT